MRAVALYRLLSAVVQTTLWGFQDFNDQITEGIPVRTLNTRRLSFPVSGTFVIVGVYFELGRWIYATHPRRVTLTYNTPDPDLLRKRVSRYGRAFRRTPELVFCSEKTMEESGYSGIVEPSLVDLDRFRTLRTNRTHGFTVGRLSRAVAYKHHPDDMRLYEALASQGMRVRIMGATEAMISTAVSVENIELLPAVSMDAAKFLVSLDCFYYRTSPDWDEPWGRVIIEAMASGLPIVAHSSGGYAKIINSGTNGFLFNTEQEALAIIERLQADPPLRWKVGEQARLTAERVLNEDAKSEIIDYYLK